MRTGAAAARQAEPADPGPQIPDGFTPIFNGKDLTGWHVSKTNHHGTTPDYRVLHGLIVGTQNPKGQGGILLTDKKYKNFEVYMEIKPDWGCDSGLFLRSSEAGEAYQVTLDYLPGGGMGGIYGERLTGVQNATAAAAAKLTPLSEQSAPRRPSCEPRPGRRRGSAKRGTPSGPGSSATCRRSPSGSTTSSSPSSPTRRITPPGVRPTG